jgi:uncharacterized protein (TIGR00375 family)
MRIISDLHIHSKHSRATSKDLSFESLEKFAKIKGIDLLGTGDFQHPLQRKEIESQLEEDSNGILWSKTKFPFILQTEISFMFSQGGKRRAVHLVILAPNKIIADKIIDYLKSKGRVDYDGRPIFGISCAQFTKDMKSISEKIEIIPAHCMTPWFGIFGSDSGFDSLQECFLDQTKNIFAIESGMSADPQMLWRLKENVNIVSFSDAHSFWPWRIGREATILDIPKLTYDNVIKAIRTYAGLVGTIETPPQYGKYHFDGHRKCDFSCSPEETKKLNGICPVCKKEMTIGVDYRVEFLAKEPQGFKPQSMKEVYELIPLHELISIVNHSPLESKKTWEIYNQLIEKFSSELNILLNLDKKTLLEKQVNPTLVEIILLARENKLEVKPGYDGTYGEVILPKSALLDLRKTSASKNTSEIKNKKSYEKQVKLF